MNIHSFSDFLVTNTPKISLISFVLNLLLSAGLGYCLRWFYIHYGNALSNRIKFSQNFILLCMTTMMIITIVKSSLALSLGLVGALSIVRFRAAIKEPEELAYLFLCIAVGLGFGAGQTLITLIGFSITCTVMAIMQIRSNKRNSDALFLTLHYEHADGDGSRCTLSDITAVLDQFCDEIKIKRIDETPTQHHYAFYVHMDDSHVIESIKTQLKLLNPSVKISFLDTSAIL
jgi:uncharacterized membrane protein YhiD involved in acid resistance